MLSSVLTRPRAVAINFEIMRTFVMVRELAATHHDLAQRLDDLEARTEHQALKLAAFANMTRKQLKEVFDALRQLSTPPDPPKKPIGFLVSEENPKKR